MAETILNIRETPDSSVSLAYLTPSMYDCIERAEGNPKPDFFGGVWKKLIRRRPKVVILMFFSIIVAAAISVGMRSYSRAWQPNVAQETSPFIPESHSANPPDIASPSVDLSEKFVTYSVSGAFQRGFKLSSNSEVVIETKTGLEVAAKVTILAPDGTKEEFVGKAVYNINRMWQWQGQGSLGGSLDFQDQNNTFVRYPGGYVLTNSAYDGPKSGGIVTSSNTVFNPISASESIRTKPVVEQKTRVDGEELPTCVSGEWLETNDRTQEQHVWHFEADAIGHLKTTRDDDQVEGDYQFTRTDGSNDHWIGNLKFHQRGKSAEPNKILRPDANSNCSKLTTDNSHISFAKKN